MKTTYRPTWLKGSMLNLEFKIHKEKGEYWTTHHTSEGPVKYWFKDLEDIAQTYWALGRQFEAMKLGEEDQ